MAGTETLRVDNPFTLDTACEVPLADWPAVERVLERAREGARIAAALSLAERKQLVAAAVARMEARAEPIARAVSQMMGKPLAQAAGELRTVRVARAHDARARRRRARRHRRRAATTGSAGGSARCRSAWCSTCRPGTTRCSPR